MQLTVSLPWHIQKRGSSNKYAFNAHAMDVIQTIHKPFYIASKPQIRLSPVVLECRVEEIVVRRITVCKFIQKECVEWQSSPVGGGRRICRIGTGGVVFEDGLGIRVGIEVVWHKVGAIGDCGDLDDEGGDEDKGENEEHAGRRLHEVLGLVGE